MPKVRPLSALAAPSLLVLALAPIACGGESPPAAQAPPPPARTAAPIAVDLSPVPEPRSLVVLARVARPQSTLRTMADWMQMPSPSSAMVGEAIADMEVGDVIDLSQPIDLALTVEGSTRSPKPAWAVSAALAGGEAAKTKLREHFVLTPGDGGVVRLDLKKEAEEDSDRRCAIYPAYGAASMRLVCGESESAVRDLAPYLVRTRTRVAAAAGKDIEIEARGAPVRSVLTEGRQLFPALASGILGTKGVPGLSTLIAEMVGDVIDLGTDLDRVTLEASIGDVGADGSIKVAFSGSSSVIGRLMTANADKAGPPPEAFSKLPADSESAFYGRGWDDRELSRPKEMLFQFARGLLEKEGVGDADAQVLERAVSGYVSLGSSGWVSAAGADWSAAAPAIKKLNQAKSAGKIDAVVEAERVALEKVSGWSLWGVELPMAKVQATVKDIVAAYNRPAVQKAIKPKLKDGVPMPTLKSTPPAAAHKLPKDTMHLEFSVTRLVDDGAVVAPGREREKATAPKKKAPPKLAKPVKVHVFVVPDGARTWLAWGIDEAQVAARVRGVVSGEGATLATRPGLEALREGKLSGGGFFDARALAKPDKAGLAALFESAGNLPMPAEDKLPTGDWGKTPMWIGVRGEGAGDRRSTTLTVRIPREAIRDLGSGRIAVGRGGRRGGF